jgi:hypothetical protein
MKLIKTSNRLSREELVNFYEYIKSKNIILKFYHGTNLSSWEKIVKRGALTTGENIGLFCNNPDRVFLTTSVLYASHYSYAKEERHGIDKDSVPVILEVNVPLHELDEIKGYCFGTGFQIFSSDVPERLERIFNSKNSYDDKIKSLINLITDDSDETNEWCTKKEIKLIDVNLLEGSTEKLSDPEYKKFIASNEGEHSLLDEIPSNVESHPYVLEHLLEYWLVRVRQSPISFYPLINSQKIKSHPEIRKAYLNIDFWEMYANSSPYRPEDIPEEILQHPRIQKALMSISSWVNALKMLYYRIDDCPESIKRHPEIQKAYMDGVKRDLINTQFVEAFYKKVNEFPDQLKSSSFLRDIEAIYWDRQLKENSNPYLFVDYLYRIKENSSLLNTLYDALPKERVDKFLERCGPDDLKNNPKESIMPNVNNEVTTANRVFKLIKVIG